MNIHSVTSCISVFYTISLEILKQKLSVNLKFLFTIVKKITIYRKLERNTNAVLHNYIHSGPMPFLLSIYLQIPP